MKIALFCGLNSYKCVSNYDYEEVTFIKICLNDLVLY